MDTARGVHAALASSHGVAPASVDMRLRERFFGDHNGLDHSRYKIVWADDAVDMYHTTQGVERYSMSRCLELSIRRCFVCVIYQLSIFIMYFYFYFIYFTVLLQSPRE
jgi:hypothetical protein